MAGNHAAAAALGSPVAGWHAATMLRPLPLFVLLGVSLAAQGPDPRVAFLREQATTVRSIDPADDDFSDLEPLRGWIGDARIVGLGEQTHGDGAAFHVTVELDVRHVDDTT